MIEKTLYFIQKFSFGLIESKQQAEKVFKIFLIAVIALCIVTAFFDPFGGGDKPDLTGIKKSASKYKADVGALR